MSKKPFQAKKQFQIWFSILIYMKMANGNKHEQGATNQQKQLDADTNFGEKVDNSKQIFMTNKISNH